MTFTIYADNRIESLWFSSLSEELTDAEHIRIRVRGQNPTVIDELILYDRPDIILVEDGRPIIVAEKTREVPTGHNVGQRLARLVKSVEHRIPTVYYFPFDARKHGEYTSVCNLNIRLLAAFFRMSEIHGVPILAINWPADSHGELVGDGTEDLRVKRVVNDFLSTRDHKCTEISRQLDIMRKEYEARLKKYPEYANPPQSVKFSQTTPLFSTLAENPNKRVAQAFLKRAQSVIYTIEMTPENCRREDPYTGTQFIYDYLWCRAGPNPEDKLRNLVLRFPLISRNHWYKKNPCDMNRKSCNWYLTANALWFSDQIVLLR